MAFELEALKLAGKQQNSQRFIHRLSAFGVRAADGCSISVRTG